MPFIRTAYVNFHETDHEIKGRLTLHATENQDCQLEALTIDFHFYRPGAELNNRDWSKDMLVQMIEQL